MTDLTMTEMMTKEDVTAMILSAKKQAGLTWEEIADKIGMSPVWTHSAAMGMNAFPAEKAKLMVSVMGLPQEAESVLAESPTKIWEQAVPTDPCIYRFYEIVGVYGPTLKALIQEKFGDGIMSAIDFDMTVTRVENPKGDRVKVEMSGKYLGYNSWCPVPRCPHSVMRMLFKRFAWLKMPGTRATPTKWPWPIPPTPAGAIVPNSLMAATRSALF